MRFKVLLYLKKSSLDKQGKAPIMGRITLNNSMEKFSCRLSCTPNLWNPLSCRLEGKSKKAVKHIFNPQIPLFYLLNIDFENFVVNL
ncbi:MAG: hypothetical protein IJV24_00170 [Prevotella sp.]|nr:hypothetical protein [Prevotella sp.]